MQTEKSKPEGERKMLETRFTEFPVLSVDPKLGFADREIPTRGLRTMPETRFTNFPALCVDQRVEISRSALETDV